MGCASSKNPEASESSKRNAAIEAQLKADRQKMRREVKILLLGAGESGKSTLLKQMRLINEGSFNVAEREAYREVIYSNLIQSIQVILEAMDDLDIALAEQTNNEHAALVIDLPHQVETPNLPSNYTEAITALWNDQGVKACHARSREYQLNDSAAYYLDAISRIGATDYVPTDQDVLRSRTKTTGITETTFNVGQLTYRMFDVGGQRSERRKWLTLFEGVNALLFLIALSEYDQQLYEDESVNRMQEALNLCDSIINSKWFKDTTIILFMNKIDILASKLPKSPLKTFFDDYRGDNSYENACEFFQSKFLALNRNSEKAIHAHFTCATDTSNISRIMSAVYEDILTANLRDTGRLA